MNKETICYWPDGTWCYIYEIDSYTDMSDDYATFDGADYSEEEIEHIVQQKIGGF